MSYDEDIEDSFTKLPVFIKDEKTSEKTPQIDSFFYPDDWDIVARSDRVTTEVIFPNNKVVTALIPKGSLFLEDGR